MMDKFKSENNKNTAQQIFDNVKILAQDKLIIFVDDDPNIARANKTTFQRIMGLKPVDPVKPEEGNIIIFSEPEPALSLIRSLSSKRLKKTILITDREFDGSPMDGVDLIKSIAEDKNPAIRELALRTTLVSGAHVKSSELRGAKRLVKESTDDQLMEHLEYLFDKIDRSDPAKEEIEKLSEDMQKAKSDTKHDIKMLRSLRYIRETQPAPDDDRKNLNQLKDIAATTSSVSSSFERFRTAHKNRLNLQSREERRLKAKQEIDKRFAGMAPELAEALKAEMEGCGESHYAALVQGGGFSNFRGDSAKSNAETERMRQLIKETDENAHLSR